ncbi:Rv2231c family pyridoxal phosphate-dependent protein CobC [Streptomyces polyrhachis]|uniref:Aminotransferase n=1 Tax=Streptomyces polyrhachis TaxID=1282885 RepID=A0ABW2GGH8_9ACTN
MRTDARPGPHAPHDLRHHGDAEVREARPATDLAVNVRAHTPPPWLKERLIASLDEVAAYPDGTRARAAVAARHDLPPDHVLLTAGAAEAFVLIARSVRTVQPTVIHPQFTEPEAALRDAGHRVHRVLLHPENGFCLDPAAIPDSADLLVLGNPTNPTSILHRAEAIASLARKGRTLVVDEAFMDAVPDEPESLAPLVGHLPGLIVLRSLTKTWGLAGLRIGYALATPADLAPLLRAQPLWPVSTPALAAAQACSTPEARAEATKAAHETAADRAYLLDRLGRFPTLTPVTPPAAPFVLLHTPDADNLRLHLRTHGIAVRRGDTFPGLDANWLRLAVRDRTTTDRLTAALAEHTEHARTPDPRNRQETLTGSLQKSSLVPHTPPPGESHP